MASLLALTHTQPVRELNAGDALTVAGESTGELYVLQSGSLSVVRDGVEIATIDEPGALIGEMSVLLGVDHSATVRARAGGASVRVIDNAMAFLERSPLVALEVATLACARLNATSALVAELKKDATGKSGESVFNRLMSALLMPPKPKGGWHAAHE